MISGILLLQMFSFFKINAIEAVKNNNRSRLTSLIRDKADLNITDSSGRTPLIWAFILKRTDFVRAKVDLEMKDNEKKTALVWACRLRREECFSALIKAEAVVNLRDENGDTILLWLCHGKCEKLHNKYECNSNISTYRSCSGSISDECLNDLLPRVDLNVQNNDGYTALLLAIKNNCLLYFNALIKAGADTNITCNGKTTLMQAVSDNIIHSNFVKVLIQTNAHLINRTDKNGMTALMFASYHSNTSAVRILLKSKVDLNVKNADGYTALMLACAAKHTNCIEALIAAGADRTGCKFCKLERRTRRI